MGTNAGLCTAVRQGEERADGAAVVGGFDLCSVASGMEAGLVMATVHRDKWARVSRSVPCPICGKADYCSLTTGVALCMRVASDKPSTGAKSMGGWIHKLDGDTVMRLATLPKKKTKPRKTEAELTAFAEKAFDHEQASRRRSTLAAQLGVTVAALERLGVGCWYDDYRSLWCTTWPEVSANRKVLGIIRRYSVPVNNGGNKLAVEGGGHGLYLPTDWNQGQGPLCIVEGGSDTAALIGLGIAVIGRFSNTGGLNMILGALNRWDKKRPIFVIGERDLKPDRVGDTTKGCRKDCRGCNWCAPGIFGAIVTAERLRAAMKQHAGRIFARLPGNDAKDSRDWTNRVSEPTAGKYLARLVRV